jgi:hypothetical protein
MKLTLSIIVALLSASTFAADVNPQLPSNFKPVKVTKTKITCAADDVSRLVNNDGSDSQEMITKGKISESVRTTWSNGSDTEYRFSEAKSFRNDGKEVNSISRVMSKVTVKKEGNQVTEHTQVRQVINFVREDIEVVGGNIQQYDNETTDVYQVNVIERVLVSSVVNSKVMPTNGAKEVEINLSDKQKIILFTAKTPYITEGEDYKIEVLKSEMTCLFEDID